MISEQLFRIRPKCRDLVQPRNQQEKCFCFVLMNKLFCGTAFYFTVFNLNIVFVHVKSIALNSFHYLYGRGSERRRSEHRKVRTSKVFFKMIRTSKDQNVENQNVEKNVESLKMTFDVLIFLDAIGNIRTSKVLVHFLAKKLSTF